MFLFVMAIFVYIIGIFDAQTVCLPIIATASEPTTRGCITLVHLKISLAYLIFFLYRLAVAVVKID